MRTRSHRLVAKDTALSRQQHGFESRWDYVKNAEEEEDEPLEPYRVEHGGGSKGKHGCKCVPCIERNREYMRRYMREYRLR
jgi:hypothetical protein